MTKEIQSEAHLTTFEAISMIVGNSIGTGIILCERDPAPDHCRVVL